MAQHFLLSAAARTLSIRQIDRLTDEEAHARFCEIRWSDNAGQPYCPDCGSIEIYKFTTRRIFKCKACRKQFSVTSGTLFHSRKLAIRDYLTAIAIFVNAVKGISALQLGRDLAVQYRTAFVLAHKLGEAIGSQIHAEPELAGEVEIDGVYVGVGPKQANKKADRVDRRLAAEQTGKRQVVVVARERWGRTLPFVVPREGAAVPALRRRIASGTTVYADESRAWDVLHGSYDMRRVNHSVEFVADDGASVKWCESYNSRLRRAEYGQHHRIVGRYLQQYANEAGWREDHRAEPNGLHLRRIVGAALRLPKSRVWCGYWQRGTGDLSAILGTRV
jgi:transposase-like protein